MARTGTHLCNGCDECRTSTIAADPDAFDWPCCEHFTDNKAPCRYAAITRCDYTVYVGQDYPEDYLTTPGAYRRLLLWSVTELKKHCFVGCDWGFRPTQAAMEGGDNYTGRLIDVTTDAINPAFPPAHRTAGVLGYHDADYRTESGCLASSRCFGDFDPDCVNDLLDRWTLSAGGVSPGDVTFTLVDDIFADWAAANGLTMPVYANVEEWNPFGRNRMRITTGHADWALLPYEICVVALDAPGASENPCDDQNSRCACNDFNFNDSITLILQITGCSGISGLVSVGMARYRSPTSLPCGVSYPSPNPCGVFIGTLSTGSGCSFGGVSWSGGVLLMIWCDGDTYNGKVYCYSNDSSCYVEQGAISITRLDRLCWGVIYLELTLPDIDCCCADEDCCPCTDGDGRIIEVNFNSVSGCSLTGQTVMNSAATGCTFTLDGLNDGDCQISGGGSIECLPGGGFTLGATTNDGVVTPGTETDWSTGMTLTVNSCDPLDLEWTGPQGTVTAVEVP